jgi:hypothetical protein
MEFVHSNGISLSSILKGCVGIIALLIIAFGASSNRKNIPWKTVILALATQLFIGICILKVPFIQGLFEQLGAFFIKVIEYTLAGLFGQPQVFNDMRRQPNLEPYSNMAPTSGSQLPVRWNYPADELLFNENAAGYVTTHTLFSPSIFYKILYLH